ncbi:MAG: zinc-ribbon domain containing protein [Pseudomonadota bacterium]
MIAKKAARRMERRRKRAQRSFGRVPGDRRYVVHPRYGDRPILSDEDWSAEEIRRAFWRHGSSKFFPETAISANIARQNCGYCPRRVYVDIEKRCLTCGRFFLFFALEQRFWFEQLGFFVDADCVHCQDCRHEQHLFKASRREYDALVAKPEKTRAEWARLTELGGALWEAGYITKSETLLKSRVPRRLARRMGWTTA